MGIISLIISISILIIYFFIRKNKIFSPVTCFYELWTIIILLSNLNLYNIYKPSNEAYALVISMLVFFFIGFLINQIHSNKNKVEKDKLEKESKHQLKLNIFYILCFCVLIFNVIDCIIVIKEIIKGTPMWQIRNWSLEPFGSSNPILSRRTFIEDVLRSIILAPFTTIVHPIAAFYLFHREEDKNRFKLLAISILIIVTSSIAGAGSRLSFVYFVACYLLSFLVMKNRNEKSRELMEKYKKYKKIVLVFISVGVAFVILYTTMRTGKGHFVKQTYTYFALPITLLSLWLPELKMGTHTYGLLTSFGIYSYIFRFFDKIGLSFMVPDIYNTAYNSILEAEKFMEVGYGKANAFVTPVYYFYIDGGYFFVCIASIVFGYIVSHIFDKIEGKIDTRNFAIYILVMYGIFVSFMRIQTAIPSYIISFILVYILTSTKSTKNLFKAIKLKLRREK